MKNCPLPPSVAHHGKPTVLRWGRTCLSPGHDQQGMATVLTAMLAGASVMAGSYVVVQYVQANQDQSVNVHSLTRAQMNAWTGAEMLQQFLSSAGAAFVTGLPSNNAEGVSVSWAGVAAPDGISMKVKKAPNGTDVQAVIVGAAGGTNLKSKTNASLTLYYQVVAAPPPPGPPPPPPPPKPMAAGHGMSIQLKGDVTWKADLATDRVIFSSGDVIGTTNSFKGITSAGVPTPVSLTSLGTIALGGSASYDTVTANCDVTLEGSASASNVNAARNLCTIGGSKVTGVATANNRITAGGTGSQNGTVQARADAGAGGANCKPPGAPVTVSTNTAATCALEPVNGIALNNGNYSAAKSMGDIKVVYGHASIKEAAGNIITSAGSSAGNAAPNIPAVSLLEDSNEAPFNAWQYSGSANYLFYFASDGTPKVRIRNVNGIADTVQNVTGNALFSNVLTSDYSKRLWTVHQSNLNDAKFVSGVVWFDGDLNIEQGTYYNTFIATKTIQTGGGDHIIYPPNFATQRRAVNPVTLGAAPYYYGGTSPIQGLCDRNNYPSNYCSAPGIPVANYNLQASGVGSYALMAGSFNGGRVEPDGSVTSTGVFTFGQTNDYVGGNIYVSIKVLVPPATSGGSSGAAWVWGYILAGNGTDTAGGTTGTGGNSYILGRINSQGYGSKNLGQVQSYMGLGGTTVVDLANVPASMSTTLLGDGSAGSLGSVAPRLAPMAVAAVAMAAGNAGRGTMGSANSVSVVAGVAGAPQFLSAATLQANAVAGASAYSGPATVNIVNATFN